MWAETPRDGSTLDSAASESTHGGGFRFRSGRAECLAQTCEAQTNLLCRAGELTVPGHDDDFLVAKFQCGSEVNGIVAAQPEIFGMLTGAAGEGWIDADRDQI